MRSAGLTRLLLNAAGGSTLVGDFEEATQYLDEAEACGREFEQPMALALVLGERGMLAHYRGDRHTAEQLLTEGLGELRRLNRVNVQASSLREIAKVSLAMGKDEQATAWAQELIEIGRRMINARVMAEGHILLARAELSLGNVGPAVHAASQALRISLDSDDSWALALLAAAVGQIAAASGDPTNAASLHAAAEDLRSEVGFVHPAPRAQELQHEYRQLRRHARHRHLQHRLANRNHPHQQRTRNRNPASAPQCKSHRQPSQAPVVDRTSRTATSIPPASRGKWFPTWLPSSVGLSPNSHTGCP